MRFSTIKNALAGAASPIPRVPLLVCATLGVLLSGLAIAAPRYSRQSYAGPGLAVHEWGTFTSIAGAGGQPVQWQPVQLISSTPDLPSFVEHFRSETYKATLRGTVRMETPVIYFYSSQETNVSVHVSFAKGLITEWYPHASRFQPSTPLSNVVLYESHKDGSVTWDSVSLSPNLRANYPSETSASHYYAARNTSATPLVVLDPSGDQYEKFLFYRGISTVSLPLTATVLPSGSVQVNNQNGDAIPVLILFERRGDKLGYRLVTSPPSQRILETPSVTGTFDSLRGDLEDILVAQGLFRDEASAMIETWRDSWFEEGSRLFYIVPRAWLDSILPLSIDPAPTKLVRVFVGRIELVTPATERAIEQALASRQRASLQKYGRFLNPILEIIAQKQSDPVRVQRLFDDLCASYE
jgi:hypothetical protein